MDAAGVMQADSVTPVYSLMIRWRLVISFAVISIVLKVVA